MELAALPLWPLSIVAVLILGVLYAGSVLLRKRDLIPPFTEEAESALETLLAPSFVLRIFMAPLYAIRYAVTHRSVKLLVGSLLLLFLVTGATAGYLAGFRSASDRDKVSTRDHESEVLQPPSEKHLFGTTAKGDDVFWAIASGCRNTQIVVVFALLIVVFVGVPLGAWRDKPYVQDKRSLFGWLKSWNLLLPNLFAIIDAIPVIFGLLIICGIASLWFAKLGVSEEMRSFLGPMTVGSAIGVWLAVPMAQMVADRIEQFRCKQFIDAARVSGIPAERIIWHHIIRKNLTSEIVVVATHLAGLAVLFEVSVGFLFGLGTSKLGSHFYSSLAHIIGDQQTLIAVLTHNHLWLVVFPMWFIVSTILGFLIQGDGLRELQDLSFKRSTLTAGGANERLR